MFLPITDVVSGDYLILLANCTVARGPKMHMTLHVEYASCVTA